MAEINLGKVTGGTVSKESIENALGFSIKDMVILSQREYERLPISEQNSGNLFFIKDFRGKIVHMNKSIWQPSIPSYYVLGTDADFESDEYGHKYVGAHEYIIIPKIVNGYNMADATNMEPMFYECEHIKGVATIEAYLTTTQGLFFDEERLMKWTHLDVSCLDTSNVTDMRYMFNFCSSLQQLDLSTFDTSKVTTMEEMFSFCSSLQQLDLSTFDTSNVTDMSYMFLGCGGLVTLNLSSFSMDYVQNVEYMFAECTNLQTVYVRDNLAKTTMENSIGVPSGVNFIIK